jgi:hypothetical protein
MTTKEIQVLESSLWGRASLLWRREDEDKTDRTPLLQGPKEECALATVNTVSRYHRDLECLIELTSTDALP